MLKLNLGCGKIRKEGFINIDHKPSPAVDIIHDLNERLPFDDGTVDYIYTSHTLEHLYNWEFCLKECYRVLGEGQLLEIIVPYGFKPRAFHRTYFDEYTLDAFIIPNTTSNESEHLFDVVDFRIWKLFPFRYHINKYFKIKISYRGKFGKKNELNWLLQKV